jgi:RHS repeat-associated protein
VISYEEYFPYGSTSYQSGRSAADVSLKRYRYTGKERDEETGFSYHKAKYLAPWLGRWTAPDPMGINHAFDLYEYADGNPVKFIDPEGREPTTTYLGSSGDARYIARLEKTWGGNQLESGSG